MDGEAKRYLKKRIQCLRNLGWASGRIYAQLVSEGLPFNIAWDFLAPKYSERLLAYVDAFQFACALSIRSKQVISPRNVVLATIAMYRKIPFSLRKQ